MKGPIHKYHKVCLILLTINFNVDLIDQIQVSNQVWSESDPITSNQVSEELELFVFFKGCRYILFYFLFGQDLDIK